MKKTIALSVAVLLALSLLLTACGGGSGSVVGTWGLKSITTGGQTYAEGDQAFDLLFGDESMFVFEFKDGGAFSASLFGESVEGTWTQNGNAVTATVDGDALEMELKGSELHVSMDGESIVLAKR